MTTVTFGSTAASFKVDSETEITAVSPPGADMAFVKIPGATITPPGTVYVTVQTAAGTSPVSTTGDRFAYGSPETEASTGSGAGDPAGSGASSGPAGSVLGVNILGHPAGELVTHKVLTRAQKLAKALKQCEKYKSKAKRAVCEKLAHRKYATAARKAATRAADSGGPMIVGYRGMARKCAGIVRLVRVLGTGCRRYRAAVLTTAVLVAMFMAPSVALAEEVYVSVITHGGPVQTEPHVYEIFWGSKWSSEPAAKNARPSKKCTKISPAAPDLPGKVF